MRTHIASLRHAERESVITICKVYGPDDAGWQPVASVRIGQWIGPPAHRLRIVGLRNPTTIIVDDSRFGMDQAVMPGWIASLVETGGAA